MKGRTFLAAVFLLVGLAAGWMTWLTWRAGEDSKWVFGVFAVFFFIFATAPFLAAPKKEPKKALNTRFVPAWQMEGMILLALLAIVASVVAHCAHLAKSPKDVSVAKVDSYFPDQEQAASDKDVYVAKVDFYVPDEEQAASDSLAERFFNAPEIAGFRDLTSQDWSAKWDLFSSTLIAKARTDGLDWQSLEKCIQALNKGKNQQTMLVAVDIPTDPFSKDSPQEVERKYQLSLKNYLKDRKTNPEKYYDKNLAIVPIAADQAKCSKGDCWVIVCLAGHSKAGKFIDVMVWAMDARSQAVLGFAGSD
jgi:hypothetical protein